MEKLFKQVFIKSDSDLPDKSDWYFTDKGMQYYFSKADKKWCDNVTIDWYLQPLPESPEAEEINEEKLWMLFNKHSKGYFGREPMKISYLLRSEFVAAVKELHLTPKQPEAEEMSAEKAADRYVKSLHPSDFTGTEASAFIAGWKEYASHLTPKPKVIPCTCTNGLEYSNCDKNCERRIAELEDKPKGEEKPDIYIHDVDGSILHDENGIAFTKERLGIFSSSVNVDIFNLKEEPKGEDDLISCDCDRPEIEDNNLCKRCGGYNRDGF